MCSWLFTWPEGIDRAYSGAVSTCLGVGAQEPAICVHSYICMYGVLRTCSPASFVADTLAHSLSTPTARAPLSAATTLRCTEYVHNPLGNKWVSGGRVANNRGSKGEKKIIILTRRIQGNSGVHR